MAGTESQRAKWREKARKYRAKHSEQWLAYRRAHYAANAEHFRAVDKARLPKRREKLKAYRAKNQKRIRDWTLKFRTEHTEIFKEWQHRYEIKRRPVRRNYNKQYRAANAQMIRERYRHHAIHSKAKRKALIAVEQCEIDAITAFMRSVRKLLVVNCTYCAAPLPPYKVHFDHIIPLARGGRHAVDNICVACPVCNTSKGKKTPEEFSVYRKEIGYGW